MAAVVALASLGSAALAADPPSGPSSVVESTMAVLGRESAAMTAPDDEIGRDLIEARRTWRAIAIELLRAASTQPWASQGAFVTGMRMADARGTIDAALDRALARPRSDAEVARLATELRSFTERGSAPIHGCAADDPARVDAAVSACLAGLADALSPFDAAAGQPAAPDAECWPDAPDGRGSTPSVERLQIVLQQLPSSESWVSRAREGAAALRNASAIAAFRPEAESISDAALGTIHLLRLLDAVAWLDGRTTRSLRAACASALASLDRPGERDAVAAELARLRALGTLIDDLGTLCVGRGGRPPLGADGAARCVGLVLAGDRAAGRVRAAAALAGIVRVQADALPGSLPTLMGAVLRRTSKDRSALLSWMADGADIEEPDGAMAAAERAAHDIGLLERAGGTIGRTAVLGTRAQQSALRSIERAADGLRLERTRDSSRDSMITLTRRLDRWVEFAGESDLRIPDSSVSMALGPMAGRLAARIDRTRTQWAASLGRPEQSAVRDMEALERVMTQLSRLGALGLDDAAVLGTGAILARWAAWCPTREGVAVTLAPLRPRIMLAGIAAVEGEWDQCELALEAIERDMPLAEFAAVVNDRLGRALPHDEPGACAMIRSIAAPVHEGSWLAADRARLATLARAWRELRHATATDAPEQAQACSAVAAQVARDLVDSLAATGADTVAP